MAEEDVTFLGVNAITGGLPEIDKRISQAWRVAQAMRNTLVSLALPMSLRWERWQRHEAPAFG